MFWLTTTPSYAPPSPRCITLSWILLQILEKQSPGMTSKIRLHCSYVHTLMTSQCVKKSAVV